MKLLFVGDVMLGRLVNEALAEKPPEYPWGDTGTIFKKADFRMCNLECVISDVGQPWGAPPGAPPKVFHFRTDSKNVKVLTAAGICAVSLANNHALDFGYEALLSMLKTLSEAGINYAGAGVNLLEAQEPAIYQVGKKKIGIIAFTDNEPQWEANTDRPGIFYVPIDLGDSHFKTLIAIVKKTRKNVTWQIISTHWGPNWGYAPPQEHISAAHALIDAGADIIFGHSAHVFRGIELYKGKPILYSAGDFIDDYAVDEIERNDQSFIFVVEANKKEMKRLILYPTVIRNFQARLAEGYEADEIIARMRALCGQFGTKTCWNRKDKCLEIMVH